MNALLTADDVLKIAGEALPTVDAMLLDERGGYDIAQDLSWQMRLIVRAFGKQRVCYIQTLDLALGAEELRAKIRKGWPEAA